MSDLAIRDWLDKAEEFVIHWANYGPDKVIAGITLDEFKAMIAMLKAKIENCEDLELKAKLGRDDRDDFIKQFNLFLVKYQAFLVAMEGPNAPITETCPVIHDAH